jgi:hypothetical protein
MKHLVSYVSGCAGDFVVNCCNHQWNQSIGTNGRVTQSASVKFQDNSLIDSDWLELCNNFSESYVSTHSVDRLLRLPVIPVWLVVPDANNYAIWARRDCATRHYKLLLSPFGDFFLKIKELVLVGQATHAAEMYLDWITDYNWALMQMRLVQNSNKIDVSHLLEKNGIDSLIDQMPHLKLVTAQCKKYHNEWLTRQVDLSESSVIDLLSIKLSKFVNEDS